MSSEEQRKTIIIRAALPLLGQEGTTTAQIAEAAGMTEADLLSVFEDKDSVERACLSAVQAALQEALDPTEVLRELAAIPLDRPLAPRLVEAIGALDNYHGRMADFLSHVGATEGGPLGLDDQDLRSASRMDVIQRAVAGLLEPDQERLQLPSEILASVFLGVYSARRPAGPLSAERIVALFLHGALS
jgi:AcrR family transcriptional regulator